MKSENPILFILGKWYVHAILALLLFFVLIGSIFSYLGVYTKNGSEFEVKDYRNLTLNEIYFMQISEPEDVNFIIKDTLYTDAVSKGAVFAQDPPAGTYIKEDRNVFLTLNSISNQKFSVPYVFDQSEREAVNQLKLHFIVDLIKTEDYNPITSVVTELKVGDSEVFPGQFLIEGTKISVYFGSGKGERNIILPNLFNYSLAQSENILKKNKLNIGEVIYEGIISDTNSSVVFQQYPTYKTKPQNGDIVDLYLKQDLDSIDFSNNFYE